MRRHIIWAVALFSFIGLRALGQGLPPVNLGYTSFLDGAPPAGQGFYFQEYVSYYNADTFKDADGDKVSFPKTPDLNVWVSLNQFLYQSDQPVVLGGKWGLDVIVPVVGTDLDAPGTPLTDNGCGLGDVLVGPYLQWDPIMKDGRPVFVHRVEFQMIFPTGSYNDNDYLNPGSNFFSFDPYWCFTWFPTSKCELSARIHYLWNAQNDSPWAGLGADDAQAGQAIHLNFATSYELIEKRFRVGINGYFLKQITDSQVNGDSVSDSLQQVLGIGPGLLYSFSQNDHLFANFYWETLAENRPEGIFAVVRWVHHF